MTTKPTLDELFERRITYPDFDRRRGSPVSWASTTKRAA
jgi:hypothetical protein